VDAETSMTHDSIYYINNNEIYMAAGQMKIENKFVETKATFRESLR
jgi:hypothetical protein